VTSPLTLSWSAVTDPFGISGYNWEISTSPTFSPLVVRDSTLPTVTEQKVGGLLTGTYYWRVQAVSGGSGQGAWSPTRSFTVTGSGADAIGAPVLAPLPFGTQYHPMESFTFTWNAVPGAASYVVEADRNAGFPAPVELRFDNIPGPSYGLTMHGTLIGNWNLRVRAIDANGVSSAPSNVRTFSISYNAPLGPAPTLVAPSDGATLELPIRLEWNHVQNPQDLGYELQVAKEPSFANLEIQGPTSNTTYQLLGLSAGTHYWRIRHFQGDASPTTAAPTAWSAVRSFTVSSGPVKVASVTLFGRTSAFSGTFEMGEIQLSGPAPAGGAVVQLTSTHPGATPVPATVTIDAGFAYTQFQFTYGQVTATTNATITATYAGSTATVPITVEPPSLKSLGPSPNAVTGGAPAPGSIALNGSAPPGGAVVTLSSNSPLAVPPASVTLAQGSFFGQFSIPTSVVDTPTTVVITASWQGRQVSLPITLEPGVAPDVWTVEQAQVTGGQGASARVAISALQTKDVTFNLTSSNPDVAFMSPIVTISAGSPHAAVLIHTRNPSQPTTVTLSVSGAGVTKTGTLTVNPMPVAPPAPLAAPSLVAPAASARVTAGQSVTFDWSDVSGAGSYTLQASSSSAFTTTVLERTVTASQAAASFTATGDRWWRVRAIDPGGAPGTWSAARAFRVR
jgi:predicted secreted protein